MKAIKKDELFKHLGQFLKDKGIELKEGSYAQGIQKGCALLTDAINVSQKGLQRAKAGVDKKLDQMRQVIHEKTAPRPASKSAAASQAAEKEPKAAPGIASLKSQGKAKQKAGKSRPKPKAGSARSKSH